MCKFSKTVPGDKVPQGATWVICPSCRYRFEFTGIKPDAEGIGESPWERRAEIGLWQGIYQTFKSVLFSPARFFRGMPTGKGTGEPLAFGLLLGSLGYMVGFFWEFLILSGTLRSYGDGLFDLIPMNWIFIFVMIISPVLVIVNMFFTGAIIHAMMLGLKGGKKGFEGTFRVIAFGQATHALSFIPFIGGFIGWFWHLVLVIIGLREIHETSYATAITAVFFTIILKGIMLLPLFFIKNLISALGFSG